MTSSLNYVPENEYFAVMIILIVLCTLLLIASSIAGLVYLKNKRKLREFLTYKQPTSMQQSQLTKGTASFGAKPQDPEPNSPDLIVPEMVGEDLRVNCTERQSSSSTLKVPTDDFMNQRQLQRSNSDASDFNLKKRNTDFEHSMASNSKYYQSKGDDSIFKRKKDQKKTPLLSRGRTTQADPHKSQDMMNIE